MLISLSNNKIKTVLFFEKIIKKILLHQTKRLDMNRENEYETFEYLVKTKNFEQLTEEERFLALQWVDAEMYENMHNLLHIMKVDEDSLQQEASRGNSYEIWAEAQSRNLLKQNANAPIRRQKMVIPVWQAASLALLFGMGAWMFKPSVEVSFSPATKANRVSAVFPESKDTLIIQKLVRIKEENEALNYSNNQNSSSPSSNAGSSVYIPDPGLVAIITNSKAGTNVSELSERKFITVQIP